jgi:hypothetical protein
LEKSVVREQEKLLSYCCLGAFQHIFKHLSYKTGYGYVYNKWLFEKARPRVSINVFYSGFSKALIFLCIRDMPEVFYFICYMS